jgi:dTDP-4-dehydrorhamnose 3,5-epimerase
METISNFTIKNLFFEDVFLLNINKFTDNRGFFFENFKKDFFLSEFQFDMVQENVSSSKINVLRGLHFQIPPFSQSKLISVRKGRILDVIVDIRENSLTYKKWVSYTLDHEKNEQIFIPSGYAHGFLSLCDDAEISYKVDNVYDPSSERSIIWNDDYIGIDWPIINPILSPKDANGKTFLENQYEGNFKF